MDQQRVPRPQGHHGDQMISQRLHKLALIDSPTAVNSDWPLARPRAPAWTAPGITQSHWQPGPGARPARPRPRDTASVTLALIDRLAAYCDYARLSRQPRRRPRRPICSGTDVREPERPSHCQRQLEQGVKDSRPWRRPHWQRRRARARPGPGLRRSPNSESRAG